jgi:hypothetical protein
MSYKKKVFTPGQNMSQTVDTLKTVILKDAKGKGFWRAWGSLFPGLGFAFFYKVRAFDPSFIFRSGIVIIVLNEQAQK